MRTTLGPCGMDKLIYGEGSQVTISNDGATVMKMLDIVHPAAKTLVEIAKSQDSEVRASNRTFRRTMSGVMSSINPDLPFSSVGTV